MVGLDDTSRFSNALPFPIKVMVHQNEPRPVSFRKITNHEWGVTGNASAKISPSIKGDINAKYGGSYETITEGIIKYADENQDGYVVIPSATSLEWSGKLHPDNNYLSVFLVLQNAAGQKCLVEYIRNLKCSSPIRKIFGLNPATLNKKIFDPANDVVMAKLAPSPKTWRIAPQGGPANVNYFPGWYCTQCKRTDRCVATCQELKEYGGCKL